MKQYLKHIKRHFPWLDSPRFKLAQVLHLTTESWANTLLHVLRRSTKSSPFCLLSSCSADWQNYHKWGFLAFFFFAVLEQKEWHQNETTTPGLWGLTVSTCSGFTGKLVRTVTRFKQPPNSSSGPFTHPFTPSRKPAETVITHNYWDLSGTKQRHFFVCSRVAAETSRHCERCL